MPCPAGPTIVRYHPKTKAKWTTPTAINNHGKLPPSPRCNLLTPYGTSYVRHATITHITAPRPNASSSETPCSRTTTSSRVFSSIKTACTFRRHLDSGSRCCRSTTKHQLPAIWDETRCWNVYNDCTFRLASTATCEPLSVRATPASGVRQGNSVLPDYSNQSHCRQIAGSKSPWT
jgi:hypothetical protein